MLKKAFTLAEVLITLGIIGIVAAMTIPTLMQKSDEREIVSKVSKALNTINNATRLAEAFNGPVDKWAVDYNGNRTYEGTTQFVDIIKPYLKVINECGTENLSKCMYDGYYKKLNGDNHTIYANGNTYALVLSDGMTYWFRSGDESTDYYIDCYIDINGKKGPNQIGKDLFNFLLYKNSKVFEAEHNDDCNITSTGWGCADYIMLNKNVNYLHE